MKFSSREVILDLNIYDTKMISCIECDKQIGEIDYDANVTNPICGQCDESKHDVKNQFVYKTEIPANKKIVHAIPI